MKNLVKIFALALVACMMLSLCACSADTENNEDTVADKETKADSETEAETEAKVTLPDTDDETEAPAVDAVLTVATFVLELSYIEIVSLAAPFTETVILLNTPTLLL